VILTGANLNGSTAVSFGGTAATAFTVNSATSITATAPAGTAGTVHITVTKPYGTSATSGADQFTYLAAPTVTGISPAAGPLTGGTSVVITGGNYSGLVSVSFGGIAATALTVNSSTQITPTAPAESAGTVDIIVTTPAGTSAISGADQYTVAAAPVVTAISPAGGPTAGGTTVILTGTDLANASAVKFGTTNATSFTNNSNGTISAVAPAL
jgi:large repetitive protein